MEDLMLATSNKMTGLDLAARPAERETKRSMTDEMLSTPKIPDSAGSSLMSPRFLAYSSSSYSSSARSGNGFSSSGHGEGATNGSSSTAANKGGNSDDMLMTPVLNTPNMADVWSGRRAAEAVDFSPENLSSTADLDLGSREPPKDLPMDSDIGLRSPCDGLLAKRRKQMREMSKRAGSFNSDSNSCDTPTSENSPRDLTTGPPRNGSAASTETDLARKLNNNRHSSPVPEHSPTILKRGFDPSSPRPPPPLLPPPSLSDDRRYKEFKRPANLTNINGLSAKENDIPAHYTPSPLAVPSPNWSVVERYFGGEMIKTPKNLDTSNVFDFLGLPPSTPRSKLYRDRSPNNPVGDCYSGRDQRLSPRLSPRFPIPEAPTDLSGRPPPLARVSDLIANEAEDLSTRSSKARSSPQNRPQVPTPQSTPTMIPTILQHPVADPSPPVKMEYDRSPPRVTPPPAPTASSSMHMVTVKTENPMGMGPPATTASDYDYCAHVPHIPTPPAPCFPNSFYLSSGFHPSYHRQVYGHPELERPSPPRTASPPRSIYERTGYHQPWPGMQSHHHHLHHHQQQQQLHHQQHQLQQHHDLHSHGSSGGGLMINSHSWTTPIKEEPSISPPPPSSSAPPSHYSSLNSSNLSIKSNHLLDGINDRKRSPRKTSNDSNETEEKRGRKKGGKTKATKEQANMTAPGESKRVYTCPHCQRAYDWNYNLNRHLKYECGKENAFQCAKCSRKFPHKQNCVYHLKRKHKIIYDTIDQYMSAGLVIFRGASDPTGHIEARPVPYGAN